MTVTEHEIQRALDRSAGRLDRSMLLDEPAIALAAAGRRRRRNLAGVAASLLLVVGCIGIISAVGDDEPTNVLAGEGALRGADIESAHAVWRDGRYVVVGTDAGSEPDDLLNRRYGVFESDDGMTWTRVDEAPTFNASTVVLAEHDGRLHVVYSESVTSDDAAATTRLGRAWTDDLVDWHERVQDVPAGVMSPGEALVIQGAAAADAGLLVVARAFPNYPSIGEEIEAIGHDMDDVCDMTATPTWVTFRLCGTTDDVDFRIELDEPRAVVPREEVLLFAPPGGDLVEIPSPVDPEASRTPMSWVHATPDGFGVAGDRVYESTDGRNWVEVETRADTDAMMAVRGEERVYRTWFPVARFEMDDPLYGMAYRESDDADWQAIDLAELYEASATGARWFNDLQVGPAGWTVVGQRNEPPTDDIGVERTAAPESDFVMTADNGFVLTGHYPVGPATLVDDRGELVREWEIFEASNPEWSGLEVGPSGVSFVDSETGDTLVTFSATQWSVLQEPRSRLEFDVLFSADGVDWQILPVDAPLTGMPTVLAIGDDELLVRLVHAFGHSSFVTEIVALPMPTG